MSETVLWTNASPTSTFNSQTVTLSDDINNYDYIKITYRASTTLTSTLSIMLSLEEWLKTTNATGVCYPAIAVRINSVVYARRVSHNTDTDVIFASAIRMNASGANQDYIIPTEVIGLK